jgi:HEAT repeat protein
VTVADLQKLLRNLSESLTTSGAHDAAAELDYVRTKLDRHRGQSLKDFGDFLAREIAPAEAGKTGEKPGKKTGKKASKAAEAAKRVCQATERVRVLYDQALGPSFNPEAVKTEINGLENLTVPQLEEIARVLGIVRHYGKKSDLLKAMIHTIIDRRGAHDRAGA